MQGQLSESRRQDDQSQRVFCIAFTKLTRVTELKSADIGCFARHGRARWHVHTLNLAADTSIETVSSVLPSIEHTRGVKTVRQPAES
jgi:hypothetical protein